MLKKCYPPIIRVTLWLVSRRQHPGCLTYQGDRPKDTCTGKQINPLSAISQVPTVIVTITGGQGTPCLRNRKSKYYQTVIDQAASHIFIWITMKKWHFSANCTEHYIVLLPTAQHYLLYMRSYWHIFNKISPCPTQKSSADALSDGDCICLMDHLLTKAIISWIKSYGLKQRI